MNEKKPIKVWRGWMAAFDSGDLCHWTGAGRRKHVIAKLESETGERWAVLQAQGYRVVKVRIVLGEKRP